MQPFLLISCPAGLEEPTLLKPAFSEEPELMPFTFVAAPNRRVTDVQGPRGCSKTRFPNSIVICMFPVANRSDQLGPAALRKGAQHSTKTTRCCSNPRKEAINTCSSAQNYVQSSQRAIEFRDTRVLWFFLVFFISTTPSVNSCSTNLVPAAGLRGQYSVRWPPRPTEDLQLILSTL